MSEFTEIKELEVVGNSAIEAIERASIDMQISTAKKWPRTLSKVKEEMISFATLDEETAASCFYTLPRGGKTIQGPSVRLAEIAVSCFQNLRAQTRVISMMTAGDTPHVIVQAVCHDLQNNVAISIEKRRRITKKRNKEFVDEDDINLACNACSAIAFRDAVFKIVPSALIKPVCDRAKKVAIGDIKSLDASRRKVVDRLKAMGALEERILGAVGCRKIDDIGIDQLEQLIGLGTALKDGNTTLEEAFPVIDHAPTAEEMVGKRAEEPVQKEKEPAREEHREEKPAERAPIETQPETVQEPAGDTDIRASLLKKLDKRMADEGVQLKFFIAATVGHIPSMSSSLKLLTELSTDALDTVDSNLDEIIKIAKAKQVKFAAKTQESAN